MFTEILGDPHFRNLTIPKTSKFVTDEIFYEYNNAFISYVSWEEMVKNSVYYILAVLTIEFSAVIFQTGNGVK